MVSAPGSDVAVLARPWVFAGWIAAQGGWRDYNHAYRSQTAAGRAEVTATLDRLRALSASLDVLLDALK